MGRKESAVPPKLPDEYPVTRNAAIKACRPPAPRRQLEKWKDPVPHRFAPATGSLEHWKGRIFPSVSLRYIHLTLKHKQPRLSTGLTVKMYTEIQGEITFRFVKQCALTIFVVRAKVGSHRKYHRTAVTKTVRQSELPESQHLVRADSPEPSDPSLPSRCAEYFCARRIRWPALRDRTCWSPKGRRRP